MIFAAIPGALLIAIVLWDVFEVIVLPRRVQRSARPARYFYRASWRLWSWCAGRIGDGDTRDSVLGFFGPLSLLMLIALWATGLVLAYSLIYWATGDVGPAPGQHPGYGTDLYFSGTTFFTLGLGDISPQNGGAHATTVVEGANGFAFLALVVGYLPVFYQSFSRREAAISLLDARAGSPPTAAELLRRSADDPDELQAMLRDWERWAAELLESHLSYPVLMFFRSQHERQSWVAALAAILDTASLVLAFSSGRDARGAELTFAIARHAAVDLSDVFERAPSILPDERLDANGEEAMRRLIEADPRLVYSAARANELAGLRTTYEPYIGALSRYLLMPLPGWLPAAQAVDDWQTSRVEPSAIGLADPIPERRLRPPDRS
ncbi:MAG: two pore domain potassium channel family protein [Dehalococcoidia bacterium]|nr:two pore domain potassium channel family protein [Dehalococcoidia bacterium]